MKKSLSLICAGLLSAGCGKTYYGSYEGYAVRINENGERKIVRLYSKEGNGGRIVFDIRKDIGTDQITISNLPKGNPLERFASLEEGRNIYSQIKAEAESSISNNLENTDDRREK